MAFLIGLFVSAPAAAQTATFATHQIRVLYAQPTDAKHQPIYEALQERRVLETLRSILNPLRLPRELTLELKSCGGKVDAYYWEATATVCYEYVELIQRHAPKVGTPGGLTRADAIVGAVVDTFLHEVGHAVFDLLDVPVFGREEDAADFFSAYVLLKFAPEDAARLFQGVGFMMASEAKAALEKPLDLRAYAGPHGTAAQRYYNLLCMAYGSDPNTFADAISKGGLPKERADDCGEEFAMLERAFRKLILPYIDAEVLGKARAEVRFNWGPLITSTSGLDALPLAE
jgi:hypothetical protein